MESIITGADTVPLESVTRARIRFEHGAGQLVVRAGADPTVLLAADGFTSAEVHSGLADVTIRAPPDVATSIRGDVGLASLEVDQACFRSVANGYESPDYATAPNRAQIRVDGGLESVRVV